MPAFVAIFVTAVVAYFTEKGSDLLFRIALIAVFIGIFITFIALFISGSTALLDSIKVSVPSEVARVWGWFMPPNTAACLIAIVTARFLKFSLDFKFKVAALKARITAG